MCIETEQSICVKMAITTKNYFNIDPLNGDNYVTWKFRVTTLLVEQEVVDMIGKKFVESDYTDEQKRREAKKKDDKCKLLIVQSVANGQIDLVRDKKTAFAMWESLKEMYQKKGLPGQLFLRRKLITMKLNEGENLEEFILRFEQVLHQLRATGAEMKDEDAICNLLLALPKSYETSHSTGKYAN